MKSERSEQVDVHSADENEDDLRWHGLLMQHINGTCDARYCFYCCVERIPL